MEKHTQYYLEDVTKLIPYARNARTHSDAQVAQIAASIKEFGFLSPIIISKDNTILCGHGRFYAAQKLGLTKVPCIKEEYLTETQKKAYILADNKLALNAGWDEEMLAVELSELQGADFDMGLIGFDDNELASIFSEEKTAQDDEFDVDTQINKEAFVQKGDVWTLGPHRLMCGDSTQPEDVTVLMDGKKANLCITDPPYNCSYKGGTGMTIMNDSWKNGEEFFAFLLAAFTNAYNALADGSPIYIFHSDAEKVNFFNACVQAGFHYSTTCIWVKNSLCIGRMDYQMKHEPVIYAFKNTSKHKFYGDRKQTTVWEFDRPTKSKLHPTMKPLPLLAYPMKMSSLENSIVLDLFGGSGSTLITADQLNRSAYLMELDPTYASVIIRRYVSHKQDTDGISVLRDGKTYSVLDLVPDIGEDVLEKESVVG